MRAQLVIFLITTLDYCSITFGLFPSPRCHPLLHYGRRRVYRMEIVTPQCQQYFSSPWMLKPVLFCSCLRKTCSTPNATNPPGAKKENRRLKAKINKFFQISDPCEINFVTNGSQTINIAYGDQFVNLSQLSGNTNCETRWQLSPKNTPYTNTSSKVAKNDVGYTFIQSVGDSSKPHNVNTNNASVTVQEDYIAPEADFAAAEKKLSVPGKSEFDYTPNINLFIDGKQISEPETPQEYDYSDDLTFNQVLEDWVEGRNLDWNEQDVFLDSTDKCGDDSILFEEGPQVTYEDIKKVMDSISRNPGEIIVIVPGGINGHLLGYFQNVEEQHHAQMMKSGVCKLENELLVPVNLMFRLIRFHEWLLKQSSQSFGEDVRKLHSMVEGRGKEDILQLLQCFFHSSKIDVLLPNSEKVPFEIFENSNLRPDVLKSSQIEVLGVRVPYLKFRDHLIALWKKKFN